jgi:hypothetical protein
VHHDRAGRQDGQSATAGQHATFCLAEKHIIYPVALRAADAAAQLMRTRRPASVTEKHDRDVVSDVDVAIEREIRALLGEATPEIGFLGEEEGRTGNSAGGWVWTLDPIDGTCHQAGKDHPRSMSSYPGSEADTSACGSQCGSVSYKLAHSRLWPAAAFESGTMIVSRARRDRVGAAGRRCRPCPGGFRLGLTDPGVPHS